MTYLVTLDFKRGPSLGPLLVPAANEVQAIEAAKREAKDYGFDAPVKKATARPL